MGKKAKYVKSIENKHAAFLLQSLGLQLNYHQMTERMDIVCRECITYTEAGNSGGFMFEVKEYPSLRGNVNREYSKRYAVPREFLTYNRQNNSSNEFSDSRILYCASVLLLTLRSYLDEASAQDCFESIELFRRKEFEQIAKLLRDNLTKQFDEALYKSRDVVSIFSNSGSVLSELKPWGCEVGYYTDESKKIRDFHEEISVKNLQQLKNDLHDEIIRSGKRHPLIRMFLKEENINEQLSLLYSGISFKRAVFRLREADKGFVYEPGTVQLEEPYVAKIVHAIYGRIHKAVIDCCKTTEYAPIDAENELSEFAYSVTVDRKKPAFKLRRAFVDLFEEKGVLTSRDQDLQFANSYLRWIFLALYLCRRYFNRGEIFAPDRPSLQHFKYTSFCENTFLCIMHFAFRDEELSAEDRLSFGTVFGAAIVTFLNKVKRREFVSYLCELAKDYSCSFRKAQELAISILCLTLNECLDSLDADLRNEVFKRCYSKTNYSIQQESFVLLKPASGYFENEIRRKFHAYIAENKNGSAIHSQPYYYFYYHHLFEKEYKKTRSALSREWDNTWSVDDSEVLGIALALRELSWQNHNWVQRYEHINNIVHIIKRCVSIIPLAKDAPDDAARRKYALAVESIAYTIANSGAQIREFMPDEEQCDRAKLLQLIFEYDLFMRKNNAVYQYYLEHPEHSSIESGPDGLLICGMLRAFSCLQNDLPQVGASPEWKEILKNERGRFKVLIARTLAYTDFFESDDNRLLLAGIAENLTNRDFLPYDHIDIGLVYQYPHEPMRWYANRKAAQS